MYRIDAGNVLRQYWEMGENPINAAVAELVDALDFKKLLLS